MIKLYMLVAIVSGNSYVLDSGLTREDCFSEAGQVATVVIETEGYLHRVTPDAIVCEAE